MTEKRFTTDYRDFLKNDRTFIKNNDKRMTFQEVVDLLNELYEEKESLKEENKFLRNKVATYKSGNALLKKTLDKEWK